MMGKLNTVITCGNRPNKTAKHTQFICANKAIFIHGKADTLNVCAEMCQKGYNAANRDFLHPSLFYCTELVGIWKQFPTTQSSYDDLDIVCDESMEQNNQFYQQNEKNLMNAILDFIRTISEEPNKDVDKEGEADRNTLENSNSIDQKQQQNPIQEGATERYYDLSNEKAEDEDLNYFIRHHDMAQLKKKAKNTEAGSEKKYEIGQNFGQREAQQQHSFQMAQNVSIFKPEALSFLSEVTSSEGSPKNIPVPVFRIEERNESKIRETKRNLEKPGFLMNIQNKVKKSKNTKAEVEMENIIPFSNYGLTLNSLINDNDNVHQQYQEDIPDQPINFDSNNNYEDTLKLIFLSEVRNHPTVISDLSSYDSVERNPKDLMHSPLATEQKYTLNITPINFDNTTRRQSRIQKFKHTSKVKRRNNQTNWKKQQVSEKRHHKETKHKEMKVKNKRRKNLKKHQNSKKKIHKINPKKNIIYAKSEDKNRLPHNK